MRHIIEIIKSLWFRVFPAEAKPRKAAKRRSKEHFGVHYYLGDLLDNMDHYHRVMREVKKLNPSDYDYFSRVGIPVQSSDWLIERELNPHFRKGHFPSRMGMHLNIDQNGETVYLGLLTFTKMKFIPGVQYSNQSIYSAVMYWDDMSGKYKTVFGEPFYIAVGAEGGIEILREYAEVPEMPRKRKSKGPRQAIPSRRWRVPRQLIYLKDEWAKKSESLKEYGNNPTVKDVAEHIFTICYNSYEATHHGLQVSAKKNGIAAMFSIEMLRTPYFFQNREKTVTKNGRTKPIFHIVRTHIRKNGSKVSSHFRGLRRFKWGNHDVTIILPSRSIFDFTAAGWDAEELKKTGGKGCDDKEAGDILSDYMAGGSKNDHLKSRQAKARA